MNNNDISITLGKRIRAIRQQKDLKITDLAKLTGLTVSMISQVERAIISPSIETLKKIGNAMDIPLSYLFESADLSDDNHIQSTESAVMPQPISMALNNSTMMELPPVNLAGRSPVVHRNERKLLSPGKGIQLYLLNPNLNGPIEFIYNEYEPVQERTSIPIPAANAA